MTTRSPQDRLRDVELISDAVTGALRAALPAMVRKEIELQLAGRHTTAGKLSVADHSRATSHSPPTSRSPGKP